MTTDAQTSDATATATATAATSDAETSYAGPASDIAGDPDAWGLYLQGLGVREKQTITRQEGFLKAYAVAGTVSAAAAAAGVTVQGVDWWRKHDMHDFRRRFEEARRSFADSLEATAFARIHNPEGNRGGDVLLIALLNAHLPDKYRPQTQAVDDRAKEMLDELRKLSKRPASRDQAADADAGTEADAWDARMRGGG